MKQLKLILTATIIAASCNKNVISNADQDIIVTVVGDITDSLACVPTASPILKLFDFQTNMNHSGTCRFALISDKKLNPIEEISIPDGLKSARDNVNEQVDYREKLVHSFYGKVRRSMNNFPEKYSIANTLNYSECFSTIANELNYLANSKARQKILLIFSDLQENTNDFSCYAPEGKELLQTDVDKVINLFLKETPLSDKLSGITVFFVYQPLSIEQDSNYAQMIALYKKLLTSRGAKIVVQATNKSYTP